MDVVKTLLVEESVVVVVSVVAGVELSSEPLEASGTSGSVEVLTGALMVALAASWATAAVARVATSVRAVKRMVKFGEAYKCV